MASKLPDAGKGPSLLSPHQYDDDASSLRSLSEQDSDSEDDQVIYEAQNSLEIAQHDRSVLEEEEEREKLLVDDGPAEGLRRIFTGGHANASKVKIGKHERRRSRKQKLMDRKKNKLLHNGEDDHLMYEMEEGVRSDSSIASSQASSELDQRKYNGILQEKTFPSTWCEFLLCYSAIIILFVIILLGTFQLSRHRKSGPAGTLSNGTSIFAPTTILISLDGFRADFLELGITPTLDSFIKSGISPKYMLPSFPSVTFPNHYTMVTGLYPEAHGIVGNTFWDPELQEEFYYTKPNMSMKSKWWGGEPLWVTAEHQDVRTAVHMWPGSEAHIGSMDPTYLDKYNGSESLSTKVHRILELIDMPGIGNGTPVVAKRPQLVAAYVPNVDATGHKFGPNSTEIKTTIQNVDSMLHDLISGLSDRNLTNVVNVVIVSDHGMTTTSIDKMIQLDDIVDLNLIEHIDGWPLVGLRPKNPEDLRRINNLLRVESMKYTGFDVYMRDVNMPKRYHFSNNIRIAPLWIVPKIGWAIVQKKDFDIEKAKKTGEVFHPLGLHGYDHEDPLMRAIFVARGPAFPHKPNSRLDPFQNIELYNIICDSLAINPKPNNGTFRLPFKPLGLHTDPQPFVESSDFTSDTPALAASPNIVSIYETTSTSTSTALSSTSTTRLLSSSPLPPYHISAPIRVDIPQPPPERPVVSDESGSPDGRKTSVQKLEKIWTKVVGKIKSWINGITPKTKALLRNSTDPSSRPRMEFRGVVDLRLIPPNKRQENYLQGRRGRLEERQAREEAQRETRRITRELSLEKRESRRTNLLEYVNAFHTLCFSSLAVQTNAKYSIKGDPANATEKLRPDSLQQWDSFLNQQQATWLKLCEFSFTLERQFSSLGGLRDRGEDMKSRVIGSEADLTYFQRSFVELPVSLIAQKIHDNAQLKAVFNLAFLQTFHIQQLENQGF
ncbi:MAG: hypothetical protein M1829_002371 [Trizodia sp. TS-e1964]|nr:MAG: hypothetical protein M1829_002371 [Trizodia sp. TS-e1964]